MQFLYYHAAKGFCRISCEAPDISNGVIIKIGELVQTKSNNSQTDDKVAYTYIACEERCTVNKPIGTFDE